MQDLRRATYLLNAILAAALAMGFLWKPAPPPRFVGISPDQVPAQVGAYRSTGESPVDTEVRTALASGSMVSRTYHNAQGLPLDFVLIGGTDRSALHDPRSCFVGADWRISEERPEPVPGTTLTARACRIARQGLAYDVLYFYVVDGEVIQDVTRIRAQMLLSALIGGRVRPVYFLRFIQPADAAHENLQRFAGGLWEALAPQLMTPSH